MAADTAIRRPAGVTIVGVLVALAGILNLTFGFIVIFSAFGDNPTYINNFGQEVTVSTFYLWFNGALMVLLGLIYFWLTRLTFAGSATAQVLISVLAVINIVFGFFHFGNGGWIQILVNLIIILIVNSAGAKVWFSQTR
jgi:hypothetical protein